MRRRPAALLALALLAAGCGSGSSSTTATAPKIDPADFTAEVDNPYYPLIPGTVLRYEGREGPRKAKEVITVTHQVKRIQGVPCVVLHDRLTVDGRVVEDTYDWYTQDKRGTVWYFGEDTRTLGTNGEVKSRAGSWEAGVDGAKPGIFMPAHPRVGRTYQQEFYAGHAEDKFRITSLTATVTVPYGSAKGDAMRTVEFTRLEPGALAAKFYGKGVGKLLEADIAGEEDRERLELVSVKRP